jgi:hypothetical protein
MDGRGLFFYGTLRCVEEWRDRDVLKTRVYSKRRNLLNPLNIVTDQKNTILNINADTT